VDETNPIACLENESLRNLISAIQAKRLRIRRAGQFFSVALPVTPKDGQSLATVHAQLSRHFQELQHGPAVESDELLLENAFLASFTFTAQRDGALLTLDPVEFSRIVSQSSLVNLPSLTMPRDKADRDFAKTLQFVRDEKLPIDENLAVQQIVADFNAGKLAAHPANSTDAPGTGMVASPNPNPHATLMEEK
jgi:hypothetical protein